jgi:hypothetical protein
MSGVMPVSTMKGDHMTSKKPVKKVVRKVPKKPATPTENKLFPGRKNYTGPNDGYFAMMHHTVLFENTAAFAGGVKERIDYVRAAKPRNQIKVRLDNMMSLGDMPEIATLTRLQGVAKAAAETHPAGTTGPTRAVYSQSRLNWDQRQTLKRVIEEFTRIIAPAVLAYVRKHNPGHVWRPRKGYPLMGMIKGTDATP